MSDPATAGNTSTPATAASTAAAPPSDTSSTQPSTTPPAASTAPPATPAAAAEPPKTEPAKAQPLFTLPEGMSFTPEAVSNFETSLRGKLVDGKLAVTPQDVANIFAEQAQAANARWEQMQVAQDREWEQQSKTRFTPAQLSAAETGIAFLTSKQIAAAEKAGVKDETPFRELAKQFKNHPVFVQVMRIVGESLAEDTFEQGAPPRPAKKSLAERMYPGAKPS